MSKHKAETCPNCGYCPHCGRSAAPVYPHVGPWWVNPTWVTPTYPYWGTGTVSGTISGTPVTTETSWVTSTNVVPTVSAFGCDSSGGM